MSSEFTANNSAAGPEPLHHILSLRGLSLIACGWQLLGLYEVWSHESDSSQVLGRYSYSYAMILPISLVLSLLWLAIVVKPKRSEGILRGLPALLRYSLLILPLLGLAAMWFSSLDSDIQVYLSMNWWWLAVLLIRSQPDQALRAHRWALMLAAALLVFLIPVGITALTARPFSPDEAWWASGGITLFRRGGVYIDHILRRPWIITPGYGWSLGAYGWALHRLLFSPLTGRLWNLIGYLLAFAGIGLVTWRLYGRAAALVSTAFAVVSFFFISALDYRPSHQLPLGVMLVTFAVLQARMDRSALRRRFWDFLAGLLVMLTMQLHAAAIIYVFGFSLFYLLEFAVRLYRERSLHCLRPIAWYGLGAVIGIGVFYLFNIVPVGGLDVYFSVLAAERWNLVRYLRFLWLNARFDIFIPLLAIGYILWRRSAADRLYLAILLPVLLGIVLLDTQGYRETYIALYAVPVGTLLVHGLRSPGIEAGRNRHSVWIVATLLVMAMGLWIPRFIDWGLVGKTLRLGAIPPYDIQILGDAIQPYTRKDDVILSTHELVWAFGAADDSLYGVTGEIYGKLRWNLDNPVDIWRRLAPSVIIDIQGRMQLPDSLKTYMAERGFQVCDKFSALNNAVTVYRVTCLKSDS